MAEFWVMAIHILFTCLTCWDQDDTKSLDIIEQIINNLLIIMYLQHLIFSTVEIFKAIKAALKKSKIITETEKFEKKYPKIIELRN